MKLLINENVLVLNRCWQAVNICDGARAFCLLCKTDETVDEATGKPRIVPHAHVVLPDFTHYDLQEWQEFSRDYTGKDVVHSAHATYRMPRVLLLQLYDRLPHKEVKFSRHSIYERDQHTCQYCGTHFGKHHVEKHLNLDHVIPKDSGGESTWENMVCSCVPCNTRKANRRPEQCGMKLLSVPKRPRWRPFVSVKLAKIMRPEWAPFMDLAHWHVDTGQHASKDLSILTPTA